MNTKLRTFQSHEGGDLLLKFTLEASSHDRELAEKFGEPEIEVGATIFTAATLTPTINGGGTFTGVTVATPGAAGTYSSAKPVTVVITDPGAAGVNAAFTVTLSGSGTISSVAVNNGGSGYHAGTTLALAGDHVTVYPAQKVKLFSGFPYTRRVNTIAAGDPSLTTLATTYSDLISTRVAAALTALRAIETGGYDLTKETVTQP